MKVSGRLLARNTALSLGGQLAPMVVALVAVPMLIHRLGTDRFGVLTLAWTVIGYFGLFDFGIGRALTQAASQALGRDDPEELAQVSASALVAMFALGAVGTVALAAGSHALVYRVLHVPAGLQREALYSFYLMALSLPFVLTAGGLRGLLEAHQHFGLVNALRVPFGILNYLAPLLVLPFSHSLVAIVAVLCVLRIASWMVHALVCFKQYPFLRGARIGSFATLTPLLRLGGWMTVSNIVSPLMSNLDRFIVGGMLSVGAVAYYATPFDAVGRVMLLPSSIMAVFFPAFAATHVGERTLTTSLFGRATRLIAAATFPALALVVTFAHAILSIWIGPAFARESTSILQWLAIGMYFTGFAQVPFGLLQAVGRPDLTAKLHLAELPIYVALIVALTHSFGLVGVAMAFTGRVIVDIAALYFFSRRALREGRGVIDRCALTALLSAGIMAVGALSNAFIFTVPFATILIAGWALGGWRWLLTAEERAMVLGLLPGFPRKEPRAA